MRNLLGLLFLVFSLCCVCQSSLGQNRYLLSDPSVVHRLDSTALVFIDSARSTSFENILTEGYQEKFRKVKGNLTFGYSKEPVWLRLDLKAALPSTEWNLEIPAPYLEYVDFYQWTGKSWHHSESGYYRSHGVREVSHTGHAVTLIFASDSTSTVYIRIAGESPKAFPLFVIEKNKFFIHARMEDVGYGVFFGILIVMFFYNLFIYIALRQTNYLIYIITIVCTFLIFSSASGYAGMYLWPDHPQLNFYAGRLSLPAQGIAVALFTIRFLEVRKYSLVTYYLLVALFPLSVIAAILLLTGLVSSAGNNLISVAVVIYMIAGIVCRAKGNVTANYFITAWTIYLLGGLFLTLRNSGFFPYTFLTTHFVEIGAALETVIIAFALAARYRRLRFEKEQAQKLALKLQLEATEKLEAKVKDRTEQLSTVNDNLRETLETNRIQTQIIEDKNAELDAFFYRISHDLKGPISSLRGLSLLAQMDVQDEKAREYIDKQYLQVERIDLIINGLINLTRLNQSTLDKTLIDFHKLTEECIQSFQSHAKFRDIHFKKDIQPDLAFHSEWTLVNAIIQNLIENAIKYSGEKDPFVHVRVWRDGGMIVIEIEDNGLGIPFEHQNRIFEMFYRATHTGVGSGLGLYILKRSVDRLKGTIDLRSVENIGSTFTVRLPF
jgi:signal transduction histidine kinase